MKFKRRVNEVGLDHCQVRTHRAACGTGAAHHDRHWPAPLGAPSRNEGRDLPPPPPQPTSQAQQPQPHVAVLDGVLERVTFCNPETGYTIARVAPDRGTGRGPVSASTELVTAVGPLLGGRWSSHVKYGRQ